jgi:hypothetical protein
MQGRRVGGRNYTDPDIVSLIDEGGGLLDPRSIVRQSASQLIAQLDSFEMRCEDAFERMCILASFAGFEVKPMPQGQAESETKDAVLVYTSGDRKKGTIFYNPSRPKSRVVFSIGHEITHSFFPTTKAGARFRSICRQDSRSARELEMLCDLGASLLTMPTNSFRQAMKRVGFGLAGINSIRAEFGTSFEACVYRMGSAAPFAAAAGMFRFRHTKAWASPAPASGNLFPNPGELFRPPTKKYRRQSFHFSESYPKELVIPWNKSVPEDSCIYRAAESGRIELGNETVPLDDRGRELHGHIEAVVAPFQGDEADPDRPDILFLLKLE